MVFVSVCSVAVLSPVVARMELDDHVEHVVGPDRREGDDRIVLLDRQPCEADALPPQQLVLLAATLVDLARAARKGQDRLTVAHEGAHVVASAADHPAHAELVAPHRDPVVG